MSTLHLVVSAGPDAGRQTSLDGAPLTVGRGDDQGLQLRDAAVSRHHLTLRTVDTDAGPMLEIAEVAGVNPAWCLQDGERVVLGAGSRLGVGASLTLGATTLTVRANQKPVGSGGTRPGKATVEMDVRTERGAGTRLASLAALGERLARCGSLQAVYRAATDWALEALPARRALLLSPDGTDVLGAAVDGMVSDLALSRTLLARVLGEQRAFLVADVSAEPDLAQKKSIAVRGIAGAMAVPAQNLVFYTEWGPEQAATATYDDDALLLLVCAAQLVSALGESATEVSQLRAAEKTRRTANSSGARMIGNSAAMKKLQVFIERVAPTTATILLNGESGTGKELCANLIHALSPRAEHPFVAINYAAIPEGLLESELFGHEKGAFTGAVSRHDGVFERAHQGTLFLDEIGEMSPQTQTRMLRVLETRKFTRVGGTQELESDVRLVAATHRDLRAMVEAGTFREDLLYRLSVIQTALPPLRERADDIVELVRHFADALGDSMGRRIHEIAPEALAVLQRYRWPGNVRELRNVVERALVLGDGPVLELDDLPPELQHAAPVAKPGADTAKMEVKPLAELERDAIFGALDATGGNKARAAALLGIDRTTLYRKLKDLEK